MKNKWNGFDIVKLKNYCKENNIKITIEPNFISLKTNISSWILVLSENKKKVVLLHKNLYNTKNGVDFHIQKQYNKYKKNKNGEVFFDFYLLKKISVNINKHDKSKFNQRKNKVERLFDEIKNTSKKKV